jgi:hypothetical protein
MGSKRKTKGRDFIAFNTTIGLLLFSEKECERARKRGNNIDLERYPELEKLKSLSALPTKVILEREIRKGVSKEKFLKVGKRGTVLLSNALLIDQLGFKKGDRFEVAKRKDRIILRKTE